MIQVSLRQAQAGFFDREKVQKSIDAKTRRALSRFGAFVRRRDQTSQRRRKKVSPPGTPPSAHLGLIRDQTYFMYEESFGSKSVVIGPILLNRRGGPSVLRVLEEGGELTTVKHGKTVTRRYQARPHTLPAFQEELKKLPGLLGQ